MWLVNIALRRPIMIVVLVVGILLCSVLAFMPPGTVSPFVVRFDAGSVPVGQLVFTSETKSNAEIQDLALFKVRPVFSTLPGVSAPPPFGGNVRTIIIHADPEKLRSFN